MLKTLIFTFILSNFIFFFSIRNNSFNAAKEQYAIIEVLSNRPLSYTHEIRLELCDEDGYATFEVTQADTLLIPEENIENFNIKYYQTRQDAIDDKNAILTYQNKIEGAQGNERIHASITNLSTHEISYHSITLYVNYPPDIIKESAEFLCDNIGTLTLDAGFNIVVDSGHYDFLWSTEATTKEIQVKAPGIYSVLVTHKTKGCSSYREINVLPSGPARSINININNRDIKVTVEGAGAYEFAIETDGTLSSYQESPVFNKLTTGVHILYVKDTNGCLPIRTKEIFIIDIPEYFTPNGDGINDTWQVSGLDSSEAKTALVYIFDKNGKLIKQLVSDGSGWDGNFNGNSLPESQYWYLIQLNNKKIKGSFALLR